MAPSIIFVLALLFVVHTVADITSTNSKYIWVPTVTDFFTAENYCNAQYGTSLASIHSDLENSEISNLCFNNALTWCYIGLNDQALEGTFAWIDGSNRDFTPSTFYSNLDNADHAGYDEDCIILFDGGWGDTPCDTSHPYSFICNAPTQEIYSATSKYIWVGPSITDWFTAEAYCNTHYSTSLVSIHSEEDNVEIGSLCSNSAENACYIGLNDQNTEGSFVWSDGSSRDYTAILSTGNTDHGGYDEDCVIIFSDGSWADTPCTTSHPYSFICNAPTMPPTQGPSANPSVAPTEHPTRNPTKNPSTNPTVSPSSDPSVTPTMNPSANPTRTPSRDPSINPSYDPTVHPTRIPSRSPTMNPTKNPAVDLTNHPTKNPTMTPTNNPSMNPSQSPIRPETSDPSSNPSIVPTNNPNNNSLESTTQAQTSSTVDSDDDVTTTAVVVQNSKASNIWMNSSAWIFVVFFIFFFS